jgi:hypothetical protein
MAGVPVERRGDPFAILGVPRSIVIVVGGASRVRGMAWIVGAEESRFLEPEAAMPGREQLVPVGPTHAVDSETGEVACGFGSEALNVFDLDWETTSFVEKCPNCVRAVSAT